MILPLIKRASKNQELMRFVINGVFASFIHFLVLWFFLKVLNFNSAAVSNIIASIFGIMASFLGNRYFVFIGHTEAFFTQLSKFSGLYVAIAVLHGISAYIITDIYSIDYRIGFIFALFVQVILGYLGSKYLVFLK